MNDSSHAGSTRGERLRRSGERVDRLLEEVQASVGPQLAPRIEELMRSVLELYGGGLERMLEHARIAARDPAELDERLCGDELVSGLLALHDLHPLSVARRVELARIRVEQELPEHAHRLRSVKLEGDVVQLDVEGAHDDVARSLLRLAYHALEALAPEVSEVRLQAPGPPAAKNLVSVDQLLRRTPP